MKKNCFWLAFSSLIACFGCNKDEGTGGSSSVEGYVYNIVYNDDNYSFLTDTFPAIGKTVYITYGNDNSVGDKTDAGIDGYFRFDYLRKGTYRIFAVSKDQWGGETAEVQTVELGSGTTQAAPLYVRSGDCYNSAMVKGRVLVKTYNKGFLVRINGQEAVPATDIRVYIKNAGEDMSFDDVRTDDNGYFIFREIQTHKSYEVFVNTEEIGETYKNILFPIVKTVSVGEPYKVYPLQSETALEFTVIRNN
jgi:hypothetical protein